MLSIVLASSAKAGEGGQLMADLDSDGKPEIIVWVPFAETEDEGTFYRLRVTDTDGNPLWEGPAYQDVAHPMIFGEWHFGVTLPEIVADIDGDGRVELLAPEPQSDVSPTFFRVLEWRQGQFFQSRSASLLETPPGSGKFLWSEGEEYLGTWISQFFVQNRDGTFEVKVFSYDGGANADVRTATVTMREDGFQLKDGAGPGAGIMNTPGNPGNPGTPGTPAEDVREWVYQQRWYLKLVESLPRGVRLMVETEREENGATLIDIREIHGPDSGFDTNVAPMVGQFRLSPDRSLTEYFDPVAGDWTSLEKFFRGRNLNLLAE